MFSSSPVIVSALILALLASLLPSAASACSCSIASSGFSFGSYDVFAATPTTTSGSLTITCRSIDLDTPIETTLSPGISGNPMRRAMVKNGGESGNSLFYNVYLQGSSTPFGDKAGGITYNVLARHGTPLFSNRIVLQGVIPPHQDVAADTYRDGLTVELNF